MRLQKVTLGNGTVENVLRVRTYWLKLRGGNSLLLHDSLYALGVRCSLVSYVSLMKLGFQFVSRTDGLDILYGDNLFGHASLIDDFLVLDLDELYYNNKTSSVFVSSVDSTSDSVVWHARLGHIGQDRMTRLAREGLLGSLTQVKLPICEPCLVGKATKKPFGKASRALSSLELIHSDICGPMNVKARTGAVYFSHLLTIFLDMDMCIFYNIVMKL